MTTYAELQQKIAELQSQAEELRKRELAEIIADVKQKIAAYGLSAADLGLQAGRESAAPQKDQDRAQGQVPRPRHRRDLGRPRRHAQVDARLPRSRPQQGRIPDLSRLR